MALSDSDEDDLRAGRILGPYELLIPVGSGGMAYVWAARHRQTQDIYALKMLRPHLAENVSFREMFMDEARIASRIRHENVAETFELVELDGILTLVMEWVDGSSLVRVLRPGSITEREDRLPRVALPIRHAVKILAETSAGLHAAHDLLGENGRPLSVVHRDVSPHNILLTLDGRVKVTDFGVAKALGKLHMTIAGQVKGKLAYMSPEQLIGGGIDRRSDVFALGTVLYETTTGKRPFTGDHDPQIMSQIIMGHFPPPSEVATGPYPQPLEKIILKAMATQPDRRFSTALQLRQALEGWLATSGPPIGARQVSLLVYERCGKELTARAAGVFSLPPPPPTSIPPPAQPTSGASSQGAGSAAVTGPNPRIESGSSAMEVNRRSMGAPADGRMSVLLGALAIGVGILLGLGVLFYVREARRDRAAALAAAADAGAIPPPPLLVASAAPSAATPTVRDAGNAPVNAGDIDDDVRAGYVKLKVPDGARLYVDGQPLPPGVHLVPRPDAGEVNVLVKAEGRHEALVTISQGSEPEIDVPMKKKLRPNPVSTVSMPPNPYD